MLPAYPAIAYGAYAIQLGGATAIGHGHIIGYDASISAGAGISTVTSSSVEDCCEQFKSEFIIESVFFWWINIVCWFVNIAFNS